VADPKMREKMTQLMDLTRPRGSTAEQLGTARTYFVFITADISIYLFVCVHCVHNQKYVGAMVCG
jgi:hypothetical protein